MWRVMIGLRCCAAAKKKMNWTCCGMSQLSFYAGQVTPKTPHASQRGSGFSRRAELGISDCLHRRPQALACAGCRPSRFTRHLASYGHGVAGQRLSPHAGPSASFLRASRFKIYDRTLGRVLERLTFQKLFPSRQFPIRRVSSSVA
jgi:hypothetical protein